MSWSTSCAPGSTSASCWACQQGGVYQWQPSAACSIHLIQEGVILLWVQAAQAHAAISIVWHNLRNSIFISQWWYHVVVVSVGLVLAMDYISGGGRDFFFLIPPYPNSIWGLHSLLLNVCWGLFNWEQSVKPMTHLLLVLNLWTSCTCSLHDS